MASPPEPSLAAVLHEYVDKDPKVFRCPMDTHRFDQEGLSYEYQPRVAGKTFTELRGNRAGFSLDQIWLCYDFDPVHGPPGTPFARRFLYADGHVE